ncbi:MAG: hypothetical protein M1822_004037 [Bathelium mastoideum]|nr:MAG: hypothetical protein M1822_004037 [Bathelium mastoideum]
MASQTKDSADALISEIAAEGKKLANKEPGAREKIISQARELIATLETPLETLLWYVWAEPGRYVALRVALDLKLFETLAADGGRPKTVAELAAPTGADLNLVHRLARQLGATGVIRELPEQTYAANTLSEALAQPKYQGAVRFSFDISQPVNAGLPSYFKERGFKTPTNALDGPWQHVHGPGHPFEWLNKHPDVFEAFFLYIYAQRNERPSWTDADFYPVHERLIEGLVPEGDQSAIIDIGGATGQCLQEFLERVPEWKGRLVLQEQEPVIQQSKGLDPRIELQVYDFFTPQPIKGARAYYLRNILHDWPDERALDILAQLKAVMKPGYSKILLNECVVADENPAWQHTSLDTQMLVITAAQERTESQWHKLIASAGLKVAGIWTKGKGNEGIIEVVI